MADTLSPLQQNTNNLFPTETSKSVSLGGADISQSDKDAILRQIHPIFLTTHSEEKWPVNQSNFDKFLGFLRLCLEGFLKLVDIVIDATIQIARLFVWVIAIIGVLIVVTLMTNTTDKFIDILNSSIFPLLKIDTQIQKVWATDAILTLPSTKNMESSSLSDDEIARQELIKARREKFTNQ